MMVRIMPHLFEIIMLSRYPQTLLGICRANIRPRFLPQEDLFELRHS